MDWDYNNEIYNGTSLIWTTIEGGTQMWYLREQKVSSYDEVS